MKTMNDIPTDAETFKAEYVFAINEMFRYHGKAGAQIWAERAAMLYDSNPIVCEAIEATL